MCVPQDVSSFCASFLFTSFLLNSFPPMALGIFSILTTSKTTNLGRVLLYLEDLQESKLSTPKTELILPPKICCLFIFLISVNNTAIHSFSQPRNLILSFLPLSHPSFSTSQWILSTASQKLAPPSTKSSC